MYAFTFNFSKQQMIKKSFGWTLFEICKKIIKNKRVSDTIIKETLTLTLRK